TVNLGTIILRYSNILGMSGLKLFIGQLPGLGTGVSRVANNCRVDIGNRVVFNGVTLYLQEDKSNVSIG
ncbi:acyltransferase, partial [Phocaeicola vulgatus]|nr:acyltransferase [Phocaeicola vulgatus]